MPNFRRFLSRRWLLRFLAAALLFGLAMLHPHPRQSLFGPTIRGNQYCGFAGGFRWRGPEILDKLPKVTHLKKGAYMSNPIQSMPTPTGEFQAHFGGPPGSADLAAECKKWENLCAKLLADRQKLRAELAQMQREYDACRKSLFYQLCKDYKPAFDAAIELAHIDDKPSVEELIAELRNAPEK